MTKLIHCPKCFHPQNSRALLISHMHTAHVDGGWKCPRCPCTFALPRARLAHMIRVHRERYIILTGLSTIRPCVSAPGWSPPPGLKLVCEDDDRKSGKSTTITSRITNKNRHSRTDRHGHQDKIVEESDDIGNKVLPSSHPTIRSKECDPVTGHHSSEYTDESITEDELVPVESERVQIVWYKCKFCGYRSLEKQPLALHIVSEHDFDDLQCSICSLGVSSAHELEVHYRHVHRRTIATEDNATKNLDSSISIIEMNLGDLYKAGVDLKSSKRTKYLTYSDGDSLAGDDEDDDVVVVDFVRMERKPIDPDEIPIKQWTWTDPPPILVDARVDTRVQTEIVQLDKPSSEPMTVMVKSNRTKGPQSVGKTYKCRNCDILFASVQSRHRHLKRSHVADGEFKCNICPCVFDKPRGLKGHSVRHHNGLAQRKSSGELKKEEQLTRRLVAKTLKFIRSRKGSRK